jgi:hypothetical protein
MTNKKIKILNGIDDWLKQLMKTKDVVIKNGAEKIQFQVL